MTQSLSQPATQPQTAKVAPTTTIDRILVMAVVILLPAENIIRFFDFLSFGWALFGLMACRLLLFQPRLVLEVAAHPVFLAGWIYILVALTIETGHPLRQYGEIARTLQMLIGGVLVACLVRDRAAVQAMIYAYIIVGVWLCFLVFTTSYNVLESGSAVNFQQASVVRQEAFAENPIQQNLNAMAFVAAQGAVVALTISITSSQMITRAIMLGIGAFCLIGCWLPSSRSGIIIASVTIAALLLANRKKGIRVVAVAAFLVLGVALWVPRVIYARLVIGPQSYSRGKVEARTRVYTSAYVNLPAYAGTGIGMGNYWDRWAVAHGFSHGHLPLGAHNIFLQIAIYWGIVGLAAWLAILYQAFRAIPRAGPNDALAFCVYGIMVSLLLLMIFRSQMYAKEFSLGLGLLVGSRKWVFPAPLSKRSRILLSALRLRLAHQQAERNPHQAADFPLRNSPGPV